MKLVFSSNLFVGLLIHYTVFIKGGEVVDRLMGANPARLQELIGELK